MTYYTLIWLTWTCPAFLGSIAPLRPVLCAPALSYERDSNPVNLEREIAKFQDGTAYLYLRESGGRTKELKVKWVPSFER